jgi:tRNA threonylcarbamoyladenosine biosynthesis protein TsaB
MLAHSNLHISDLTLLAVSQGPGSFNGLRIGFSVAKGLAMALSTPLIAIPTLDIVASAQPEFAGVLIAVLQAGRSRICAGSYRWQSGVDSGWRNVDEVRIVSWESLLDNVMEATQICGEIDDAGRALIEASSKNIHTAAPAFSLRRAGFLAELAWARWRSGHIDDPALVTPLYLHQPGVPGIPGVPNP